MKFDIFVPMAQIDEIRAALAPESEYLGRVRGLETMPCSTASLRAMASQAESEGMMVYTASTSLLPGYNMLKRMSAVMEQSGAPMAYSDYVAVAPDGTATPTPLIDCVTGSVRDDFNFGPLQCYSTAQFKKALAEAEECLEYAALYDVRLRLSATRQPLHVRESLYKAVDNDTRLSGQKQFDYVDPRNRDRQVEMERVATAHLRRIGAWLAPQFETPVDDGDFDVEASVIIPVRNRRATIADAVESALGQECDFEFNVIVVDNHSTDGTGEVLAGIATRDGRLKVITPGRDDLGIGGCWDVAVNSPFCGRYAVQLDSDDLYSSPATLARIVDKFRSEPVAMVIGSYSLTDFNLNPLPPGIIDHREWTPDNGRNNALRINGLGAPRAFMTSVLRRLGVPNVSYGEDYALGLALSLRYQIGRIYDSLYLCRRWEGNSDASLPVARQNINNEYKDMLRTLAIEERIAYNNARRNG